MDKLRVGHLTVEVVFFDPKERPKDRGYYDPEAHRIGICSALPPEEQIEVLFHELVHAWLWASGHSGVKNMTEERLASLFGRAFAALLVQNAPAMLSFLAARLIRRSDNVVYGTGQGAA